MDQPGNGHFTLHMSQQTLNGRGGYHGRAGSEGNGHPVNGNNGNGQGASGYNGYVAAPGGGPHDQPGHPDQQAHGGPREHAEYVESSAAAPDASAIQPASAQASTGPEAGGDDITAS